MSSPFSNLNSQSHKMKTNSALISSTHSGKAKTFRKYKNNLLVRAEKAGKCLFSKCKTARASSTLFVSYSRTALEKSVSPTTTSTTKRLTVATKSLIFNKSVYKSVY